MFQSTIFEFVTLSKMGNGRGLLSVPICSAGISTPCPFYLLKTGNNVGSSASQQVRQEIPHYARYDLFHAERANGDCCCRYNAHVEDAVLAFLQFFGRDGEDIRLFTVLMACEGQVARFGRFL